MNGKDKRQAPRDKHDSVIEIFNVEGKVACIGRLIDFSSLGASFSVGVPIVMPDKFRVRLRLMDKGVLEAEARVAWMRRQANATRYGIKFDSLKQIRPKELK
ncbi:MAG: hypothetical protein A2270_06975 [Elusimicrobia bacterium RIFOXYA12_FULL_51_18]|nr:MAG: hypothetical protein A2270_06975 [Elusimicrobia bacterium RIFOXYA12_FULL_51_18]OGS28428.1 MAG: hypothetical protein A2218_05280 [Elusimicrobia bacterium RIFOXYA2_FULL_53_38]